MSADSRLEALSRSSSWARVRLRRKWGSSSSSGGSESDALGVDLPEGVFADLVFRSMRPDEIEDDEEDC